MASYIAMSALRIRSGGSEAGRGHGDPDRGRDEQIVAVDLERVVERAQDPLGDDRSRRRASTMSSSRTVNSSPPSRATVSPGRSAPATRPASAISRLSPTAWLRLSLTSLKRSMSRNSTAQPAPGSRSERCRIWLTRSMNSVRLGSPVSVSCRASCWRRSCAIRRSVTSDSEPAIRVGRPSTSRIARPRVITQRQVPSAWRIRCSDCRCGVRPSRWASIAPRRRSERRRRARARTRRPDRRRRRARPRPRRPRIACQRGER